MKETRLATVLRWLVVILLPFFLTASTALLIIAWDWPSYPRFEYPRIAPDRYGFGQEERVELAEATLAYLRRPEPSEDVIYMLEELRLPGTDEPLYNDREIGHMIDVKDVTDAFKWVFRILGLVVIGGVVFLLSSEDRRREGYRALHHGGVLVGAIVVAMIVLIFVAWNTVFTQFHELLFPPGSWTFAFSDSLIRLFPEQFWFDFGVIWAGAILLQGLLLGVIGYYLLRRDGK